MRRAVDKLISGAGLVLVAVLASAGCLLAWGHYFIAGQVHDQLVMQQILMPSGDALRVLPASDAEALEPYAGSLLDSGPEAKAFADHYLRAHLDRMDDDKTYAEVGEEWLFLTDQQRASPEGRFLDQVRTNLFTGETLRGLLLYAYAFATIGTIAGIAALVSFAAAIVLLALVVLGFEHSAQVGV